jgi:hypothetical protein
MEITRQAIQILSEPPGSFLYHLITLLSLQVVFAISYSRWRRQPEDDYARNMSFAAGAIFVSRLIILLAGLYFGRDPVAAASILPPLEEAINTASVFLVVWALVPPLERYPRALDILLIGAIVLSGVLYLFFAQEWQNQLAAGEVAFFGTPQATIWSLIQISVLAIGWGYLLFNGRSFGALPLIIIGVLLIAHVFHLWNYPEFIPTNTNVAYPVRLGNLIAYSLWAIYAYLYSLTPLLESESRLQDSIENFGNSLEQAAQVIATQQPQRRLTYALVMMNQLFDPTLSAIGLLDEDNRDLIQFYSLLSTQSPGEINSWIVDLSQQTTLSASLKQDGITHLQRDGLGSRQLYAFFDSAGIEPTNTLLVYPMDINGNRIGLLVLAGPEKESQWTNYAEYLMPGLSHYITQALLNSQTSQIDREESEPEPVEVLTTMSVPAAIVMDKARVQDLEFQLQKLNDELKESEKRRRQAEINATAAQKQARYLAAALRAAQPAAIDPDPTSVESNNTESSSQENAEANINHIS